MTTPDTSDTLNRISARTKKEKTKKNVSGEHNANVDKSTDSSSKLVTIEAFTPSVLNNQIVNMRKIIKASKQKMLHKMRRDVKDLTAKLELRANERSNKRVDKLKEEIVAMDTIKKDEVSKFALVNKDSAKLLLNKPNLSPAERVLFKVATTPIVEANVKAFRLRHPGCDVSCAFMLQRLGLQYQAKRAEKAGLELKEKLKSGQNIVDMETDLREGEKLNENSSDQPKPNDKQKEEKSVIEKVLTKTIQKAKINEKKTAMNKKKKGEKTREAPVEVKPIDISAMSACRREAVVKKLNLHGGESDDEDSEKEDDDVDMESSDEGGKKSDSEGDESEENEKEDNDEDVEGKEKDGLSAFFLNSDGTSREVIASEDVEDEEEEDDDRGAMRIRGMRSGSRTDSRGRDGPSYGNPRGRMQTGMVGKRGRGDRGRGTGINRGGRGAGENRGGRVSVGNRDGSLAVPPSSVSPPSGGDLHPSWIAKQKQKELMKAGPSGKKITFD